jgi:hypothetical protein
MRPQVIWTRLRDLKIDKRPDWQRARYEDQSIDLRRVASRAANGDRFRAARLVFSLADGLEQHLQRLAHQRLVLAQRNRLLRFHDRVAALFGDAGRHRGQIQGDRFRARLRRIGEDPDVIEFLLFDKIEQRLELLIGLTGIADDQGGAHHDVRHPGAGMVDEAARHGDVAGAVHVPQHDRVGVLDRHVEVGQERVVLGHDVDHA